jgi:hypothetical protein
MALRHRPQVTRGLWGPMKRAMSDAAPEMTPANDPAEPPEPARVLSPAAQRALAEAEERRAARDAAERDAAEAALEHGGPTGPEPTRYGDWEKKGLAVDF